MDRPTVDEQPTGTGSSWRTLTPKETRVFRSLAGAIGVLSGVAQFLGAYIDNGFVLFGVCLAAVAIVVGAVMAARRLIPAVTWTIVLLLAVAVGGVIGLAIGRGLGRSTPAARDVEVRFDEPSASDPPILPRSRVNLSGTVRGLPTGHQLWIVSRVFGKTGTDYFILQGAAIADQDGPWTATDSAVGGADDYGIAFVFTAIDADDSCNSVLETAGTAAHDHRLKALPKTCHPLQPTAIVHTVKKP